MRGSYHELCRFTGIVEGIVQGIDTEERRARVCKSSATLVPVKID